MTRVDILVTINVNEGVYPNPMQMALDIMHTARKKVEHPHTNLNEIMGVVPMTIDEAVEFLKDKKLNYSQTEALNGILRRDVSEVR